MVKTSARGCDACTLLRSNHLSVRMRMSCAHDADEVFAGACHLCANFALASAPDSPLPLRCTTLFTRRKPGEPKKKCVRAAAFTTHDGARTLTPAEVLAGAEAMMGLKPEHRRELMLVDGKSRKPEHEKRKRKPKAPPAAGAAPPSAASGSGTGAAPRKLKLVGSSSRAPHAGDGDDGEEEDELYDSDGHGDESGDADVESSRFDPLALYVSGAVRALRVPHRSRPPQTTSASGAGSSSADSLPHGASVLPHMPGGAGAERARPRKRARNEAGAADGDGLLPAMARVSVPRAVGQSGGSEGKSSSRCCPSGALGPRAGLCGRLCMPLCRQRPSLRTAMPLRHTTREPGTAADSPDAVAVAPARPRRRWPGCFLSAPATAACAVRRQRVRRLAVTAARPVRPFLAHPRPLTAASG